MRVIAVTVRVGVATLAMGVVSAAVFVLVVWDRLSAVGNEQFGLDCHRLDACSWNHVGDDPLDDMLVGLERNIGDAILNCQIPVLVPDAMAEFNRRLERLGRRLG